MAAERRDQGGAVGQVLLFGIEDGSETALLPRGRGTSGGEAGRIADDVDQPVEGVQAPQQVVVLAVGTREEPGEMAEADAAQAGLAAEPAEAVGVLRAQAIDQDAVELVGAPAAHHGKGEHVPEGKAQVTDDDLAALLRMPAADRAVGQQGVELAGAGFEIHHSR